MSKNTGPAVSPTKEEVAGAVERLDGRMLYQAFADTFSGGGWTDAPAWEDYAAAGQERYERAAERLRELLGGAP